MNTPPYHPNCLHLIYPTFEREKMKKNKEQICKDIEILLSQIQEYKEYIVILPAYVSGTIFYASTKFTIIEVLSYYNKNKKQVKFKGEFTGDVNLLYEFFIFLQKVFGVLVTQVKESPVNKIIKRR